MLVSLAAIICMAMTSCSDHNEPSNPDSPSTSTPTGELEFAIELPTSSGDGSNASPAIVNGGDTLSVSITQNSVYKDPDGTIFTCEPRASIVLYAESDTVYAKDIAELTQMAGNPDISNDKTSGYLAVDHTVQKFCIGDQSIVFDLSHEILTHVNSVGHPVEMPYVRLNPAKFGSGSTTEEKHGGRCVVGVTGVTVRPLAATRGETVRDTAMYEVSVRFNLEAESVHTPGNEKQTIEFSVNYMGGVETVTELLDPVATLSYEWSVRSGTSSVAPPFLGTPGSAMEV